MIRAIENDASLSSADKKRMIADLRRTALAIRATVGDKAPTFALRWRPVGVVGSATLGKLAKF